MNEFSKPSQIETFQAILWGKIARSSKNVFENIWAGQTKATFTIKS